MFELSSAAASLADLFFGAITIWMVHTLYKTPRKRWQSILTWVLIYAFLILFTHPVESLMPDMTYERASMVVGFCGIFAYLYLFPNIPISQRIFTYFMVDTSQTLLVLLGRVFSTLGAQLLGLNVDAVFLCVYLPATAAFIILFRRWLRDYILTSLAVFRTQLTSLAVFSAVCYLTLLLQVPTWEPWSALTVWTAGGALGMIVFVVMGYFLAFRTLRALLAQETVENSARQLSSQMVLSEQYYQTLLERIEQLRIRDHDLRHHVNALSGLCSAGKWDEVCAYVEGMSRELPPSIRKNYCGNGALDALLGHYEELCNQSGIDFRCQVRLPELGRIEPLHLCVIFGNGLQNALEATERLPSGGEGFISVRAVVAERRMAISISNRFSGGVSLGENGEPVSSKAEPGHGLGLASIRETARRYGGWCGVTAEGDTFTLNVTLSLEE